MRWFYDSPVKIQQKNFDWSDKSGISSDLDIKSDDEESLL